MLERALVYGYPRLLQALIGAALLLPLAAGWRLSRRRRPPLGAPDLLAAAAAFAGALVARLAWVPRVHHLVYDELQHLDAARNLARHGAWAETVASLPDLGVLTPTWWPGAHHALLAAAFALLGDGRETAFAVSAVLGAGAAGLGALAASVLFRDARAGAAAGLLLAASPLHAHWSGAADLTAGWSFWLLLVLLWTALWLETREPLAGWSLAAALAVASQARPEGSLLALPVLAALAADGGLPRGGRAALAGAAALVLAAVPAWIAVRNRSAGLLGYADAAAPLLLRWPGQTLANAWWLVAPLPAAGLLALAAPLGARESARRLWPGVLLLGTGAAFLLFYGAFAAGRFDSGIFAKYALTPHAVLVLLAAGGTAALTRTLPRPGVAAVGAAACLAASMLPGWGRQASHWRDEERARFAFLELARPSLPPDAWLLTHSPPLAGLFLDRPAVSARLWLEDPAAAERGARGAPLVLFKDFWWHEKGELSRRVEARLLETRRLTPLAETRIAGLEYGFYLAEER